MTRGDLTIANSEFTKDHVVREHGLSPDRVVTIPRGVDLHRFNPEAIGDHRLANLRDAWGIGPEDDRLILLLAGRLTRWKGQRLLIQALARLKAESGRDPMLLILAGEDQGRRAYAAELKTLIGDLGLDPSVRLVGHVSDMPAAYLLADAAAAPSLEPEAFGRTAVEPQAMGRPVLAADHGAVRETVAEERPAGGSSRGILKPGREASERWLRPARRAAQRWARQGGSGRRRFIPWRP